MASLNLTGTASMRYFKLSHFLLRKIQTDDLEQRFGLYRQLPGDRYHVFIRQVLECENKLHRLNISHWWPHHLEAALTRTSSEIALE